VATEVARLGGVLGAAALAALILLPGRRLRLAALTAWAAGGVLLLAYLEPLDEPRSLIAATLGTAAVGAVLAVAFTRWPWLVALAALAMAPARIPLDLGDERANLLVPLYAVIVGAALALAWALWRGPERRRELGPLAWPVAAFVTWTGLSLLWTDDVTKGAVDLAAFYLPFGLLTLVIARLPWNRRWLTALGIQLVAMALVFTGIGLYQWLTRDVFWNPKVEIGNAYAPFFRVNSVFWDPSIYGRFLVIGILALVALVLFSASGRLAAAAVAGIAAIWLGLLVSFSQSSFAALMAAVLAAGAFAWGRRAVLVLGSIVLVLVAVGFAAPQVRAEIRSDFDRVTGGRSSLVSNGVRIAAEHPALGVGVGGFERAYADRTGLRGEEPRKAASHNTPVTVAAETGLPGFALLAWLVITPIALGFRRASRSFAGRASLIVALVVLAIGVHSLFYDAFFEDPLTWGSLGLAATISAWRGDRR
jgi:O-antigen ligase